MNKKRGIVLVLITAIISGFANFINSFSVAKIDPSLFTFLKNVIVVVFLLSLILLTKEIRTLKTLKKKQWIQLSTIGLIGGSIPFLLFFKGLSLTTAAQGAFIHKTLFIYATLFAFIFLKEKVNKKIFLAAIILLVGNFLLLKLNAFSLGMGDLLVLIAALFWASENVLSKHVLKELSGNIVAFGRMFFGSLFILAFLAFTNKIQMITALSLNDVLWTLITSVILLLFLVAYYNGLKYTKVSVATSILLLGSPITTSLSFIFSDASVALPQLTGILLIVVGVLMVINFVELSGTITSRQHIHNE